MLQKRISKAEKINEVDVERRFVGYISSIIHYNSINFDKKDRRYNERFSLVFNEMEQGPLSNNEGDYYNDQPLEDLEYQISNPVLYATFMSLTEREQEVLNLSFCQDLSDTDISSKLGVSQQNISKTKKNALKKLRKSLE